MTAPAYDFGTTGLMQLRAGIRRSANDVFRPAPTLTVSEWADEYRRLPSHSPVPGQWRTDYVPYLRRIHDVLGDESVREVVFAKSSQVGGSSVGENFIGFTMDQAPGAVLMVWPAEDKLKKWSLKRLDPMIEDTPVLRAKFARTGRRDSGDSIAYKEFPGGWLNAITARSTTALKSDTARIAIAEEVDEWDGDINDQGDPLELLLVRLRNYWNRKLYVVSTPTTAGKSRVWSLLQQSTWEEYWVPCPHCQAMQVLRWRDFAEGQDRDGDPVGAGEYRLTFDRTLDGELVPGSAAYVCGECAATIEERWKRWMLQRGEWRARFPGRDRVGFHINTLYSPLCSWDDVARAFLSAKDSPSKLKVFVNTWLGLPFRDASEVVAGNVLAQRAISYPLAGYSTDADGERIPEYAVPSGVGLLTAAVDVQGDRLELLIMGWGAKERAWVYRWEQINGEPGQDAVWRTLDEWLLKRRYRHEDGAELGISACCVDAGHLADKVWRYCEARRAYKIIATVGRDGWGRKLIDEPDEKRQKFKRSRANRKPMHVIGIDSAKAMLYSRLRLRRSEQTNEAPPGYIEFPDTLDPVFYDQLTSEILVSKTVRNRSTRVWDLPAGRRNEALDLTVYNMAALGYLGQKVINQLGDYARIVSERGKALAGSGGALAVTGAPRGGRRILSRGETL